MSKVSGVHQSTELPFDAWRAAVDRQLFKIYGITIADADIEHERLSSHWEMHQSPNDFVDWFGLKYDLDPKSAFGL